MRNTKFNYSSSFGVRFQEAFHYFGSFSFMSNRPIQDKLLELHSGLSFTDLHLKDIRSSRQNLHCGWSYDNIGCKLLLCEQLAVIQYRTELLLFRRVIVDISHIFSNCTQLAISVGSPSFSKGHHASSAICNVMALTTDVSRRLKKIFR